MIRRQAPTTKSQCARFAQLVFIARLELQSLLYVQQVPMLKREVGCAHNAQVAAFAALEHLATPFVRLVLGQTLIYAWRAHKTNGV